MSEYPKNRTDLILSESVHEDMTKINDILVKYRGLDKKDEWRKVQEDLFRLMREVLE